MQCEKSHEVRVTPGFFDANMIKGDHNMFYTSDKD